MEKRLAVVITLGKSHIHYCKALISSIKYFNPELEIIIIKDGIFKTDFARNHQNVHIVDSKEINKIHGLDLYILLNKLNILFLPQLGYDFESYIHLDADSIVTSKIRCEDFQSYDFVMLQGNKIECKDEKSMNNLRHYAFDPVDFKEYTFDENQLYYFSASHIAINKRIIPKLIEYLRIHRFELNKEFLNDKRIRFNDQGFFNLMINHLSHIGELRAKLNDVGIYGKQKPEEFPKLTLFNIQNKIDTGILFIHYTASSRKITMKAHNFGEILDFFLKEFYNKHLIYKCEELVRIAKYYKNKFFKKINHKIHSIKKNPIK